VLNVIDARCKHEIYFSIIPHVGPFLPGGVFLSGISTKTLNVFSSTPTRAATLEYQIIICFIASIILGEE